MTAYQMMEKMMESYKESFDFTKPVILDGFSYDAHAEFNVTNIKYVLVEKAQLWRADCFEHVFFSCRDSLSKEDLISLHHSLISTIEPNYVRKGEKWPKKDHMCTDLTFLFFLTEGCEKKLKKSIRHFSFSKSYKFGFRGYAQARLLIFDCKNKVLYANRSARELYQNYKTVFSKKNTARARQKNQKKIAV